MALDMEDRRTVLSSIARSIDVVLTPSNNMGRIIDACGIFPVPARTIHSGHDLSWVSEQSAPHQNHLQRFGFIGQWIPAKGLHQIVEAFQTLKDRRYAQLFIYGNAEENSAYATALQEQVADDPQIHWMGAFPHERLGTVLNELDILIVPSQWHENNPRVIQEAFAAKVPVIASDVGGIAEFVEHGVNGLLYPHASVSALRALLERVLDEPDLVQQLQNGIKPVKTMAEEVDEIIEIYRNLVPICAVC
jgi:glycosyltransferase involved in cell wall biosynthesis